MGIEKVGNTLLLTPSQIKSHNIEYIIAQIKAQVISAW